jgi:hypothetical protein
VADDEIYLVVNAGCREKDLAHIGKHLDAYKVVHRTVLEPGRLPTHVFLSAGPPIPEQTRQTDGFVSAPIRLTKRPPGI